MAGDQLWLASSGLLSKFGFNDGDDPDEFIDWVEAQGLEWNWSETDDWHEVLRRLVRERLIPVLDQRVEVYDIETSHNPIRAKSVDGVPLLDLLDLHRYIEDILTPNGVWIAYGEVLRVLEEVAGPLPRAVSA